MRVVPFYGEKACKLATAYDDFQTNSVARKVIKQYELYHKGMQGKAAGLKASAAVGSG